MARIKGNSIAKGFSGKLDDIVFKHYRFGTVISKYPDMSKVKRTKAQKKSNSRFAEAVDYAQNVMADPVRRKVFEKKAAKTGRTVYHLALSQYLKESSKSETSATKK